MSFSAEEVERYARNLVLREVRGPGQQKLKAAKVAIVGAGGLGAPAALYLAAAGLGHIALADGDQVDLTNLQRQILHTQARIGQPKASSGQLALAHINPEVQVEAINSHLSGEALARNRPTGS